jgi:hypothetical protein
MSTKICLLPIEVIPVIVAIQVIRVIILVQVIRVIQAQTPTYSVPTYKAPSTSSSYAGLL